MDEFIRQSNRITTPYSEYKEYREEHAVPMNESRYALWERNLGIKGKIASTATINTCKYQGKENIESVKRI